MKRTPTMPNEDGPAAEMVDIGEEAGAKRSGVQGRNRDEGRSSPCFYLVLCGGLAWSLGSKATGWRPRLYRRQPTCIKYPMRTVHNKRQSSCNSIRFGSQAWGAAESSLAPPTRRAGTESGEGLSKLWAGAWSRWCVHIGYLEVAKIGAS